MLAVAVTTPSISECASIVVVKVVPLQVALPVAVDEAESVRVKLTDLLASEQVPETVKAVLFEMLI